MTGSTDGAPLRIFMSYRRADTGWAAVSLFDRLADHFGRDKIFMDVDSIDLGEDFVEAITTAVGSSDALLALIGNGWLTAADQNGRRRLDSPGDFVRLEIEAAITQGVRVIPILIDGTPMPREDQLPESLAALARRQALELNPNRFGSDFQQLLPVLNRAISAAQQQRRKAEEAGSRQQARQAEKMQQQLREPSTAHRRQWIEGHQPIRRMNATATAWVWVVAVFATTATCILGLIMLR